MTEESVTRRAPRGTRDLLPPESWEWQRVVRFALNSFARAGYAPIYTPMFEHTEVFERGVGAASEVVDKQMYTFTDRAGRSLTLRPEATAPIVRAVLEHGLYRGPLPLKLAFAGPMFRQERPQRARYRQFFQVDIECIGTDSPIADAEVIDLGKRFLTDVGVDCRVVVNSIGHPDLSCRQSYLKLLTEFLEDNRESLAAGDRARIRTNPLRTFDSKEPQTVAAMEGAPLISKHLCPECREHFESVQALLGDLAVGFEVDPRLVRGLDYYTRTAFEYVAPSLGSQDAVGGGGRYDGLAESLGGPHLAAVGFALGLDRILAATTTREAAPTVDAYVVAIGERAARRALSVVTSLRRRGIGADLDLAGRGLKGQMKDADRSGAATAVIVGEAELAAGRATVKDLATGEQESISFDALQSEWRP
jgi:histidyl-tRNA synthetase